MSKKSISVMLALVLIVSIAPVFNITALAGGGSCFTFGISNNEAELIGFDEYWFMQYDGGGIVNVPSTYESGGIVYPVTRIGERVFSACSQIDGVSLPNSIKYIDGGAFQYCYALTSITIPDSVTFIGEGAFYACENLASIKLSESLYDIEKDTFSECTALSEITIPDSVASVGEGAFWQCSGLTAATIGNGVKSIGKGAFESCISLESVNIPASCESIGAEAFYNCGALSDLTFEEGLKTIGESAFAEDHSLSVVKLPDTVETMERMCFNFCQGLTQINMPQNLKTLGEIAFYNCDKLESVHFYDKAESIGEQAFGCCSALQSITVDGNNAFYSSLDGHLFDKNRTTIIQYALGREDAAYSVPETVVAIGTGAFMEAMNIEALTLPDGLVTIGDSAFHYCSAVGELFIPAKVSSIGAECFNACFSLTAIDVAAANASYASVDGVLYTKDMSRLLCYPAWKDGEAFIVPYGVDVIADVAVSTRKLKTVIIPEGVTEIGESAFSGCNNLVNLSLPSTVKLIGRGAFMNTAVEGMVIPEGVTTIYQIFQGCDQLKTVVLPESLTEIKLGTFDDDFQSTAIYYRGSEAQWSNITVEKNNTRLENGDIICNFTDKNNIAPSISGCQLAGDVLNVSVDYAHNVSGSTALIGIYDGNKLLSVGMQYVSAGSAESEFSVPADSSYAGKTVKVLFWDDPNSMNNLCGAASATIK